MKFRLSQSNIKHISGYFDTAEEYMSTCPRSLALMLFTWCDWVIFLPHPAVVSRWEGGNVNGEAPSISNAQWKLFPLHWRSTSSSALLNIGSILFSCAQILFKKMSVKKKNMSKGRVHCKKIECSEKVSDKFFAIILNLKLLYFYRYIIHIV